MLDFRGVWCLCQKLGRSAGEWWLICPKLSYTQRGKASTTCLKKWNLRSLSNTTPHFKQIWQGSSLPNELNVTWTWNRNLPSGWLMKNWGDSVPPILSGCFLFMLLGHSLDRQVGSLNHGRSSCFWMVGFFAKTKRWWKIRIRSGGRLRWSSTTLISWKELSRYIGFRILYTSNLCESMIFFVFLLRKGDVDLHTLLLMLSWCW